MRRLICGIVAACLLTLTIAPWPLAAAPEKCYWILVGEYWEIDMNTGEINITYYYKWFCPGLEQQME